MKALRNWMKGRSSGVEDVMKLNAADRANGGRGMFGANMDDHCTLISIILAMADVMEAAEQRTEFRSSPCVNCWYHKGHGTLYKMCDYHAALKAATSVIKEVTG